MLLAVSQTLQGFLQAVIPPPLAHTEIEQWVRIAELTSEVASEHANRLVLNLYSVEPDPTLLNRTASSDGGVYRDPPMPLSLRFLITYFSDRHELVQEVLGQVVQAFHTCQLIQVRQYLAPEVYASYGRIGVPLPERIRLRLETPEGDKISHLWSAMRQGRRLALYYRADVALIPSFLPGDA